MQCSNLVKSLHIMLIRELILTNSAYVIEDDLFSITVAWVFSVAIAINGVGKLPVAER